MSHLRKDAPGTPAFLMIQPSRAPEVTRERVAEWLLANWLSQLDSNILGVRRVDEHKNGTVIPVVHIAIPLRYERKQLARTLAIKQIEDTQSAARVNLASSSGSDEAMSYIRLPADVVVAEFKSYVDTHLLIGAEINDETLRLPDDAKPNIVREHQPPPPLRDEDAELRVAILRALAIHNADIEPEQLQIMMNRRTREKWVRITNIERNRRTAIKLAVRQIGIKTAAAPKYDRDNSEWAILFPLEEARKLLLD